ncbi:S-layer homology domain-containing protein [Petroclostridium sp. X23]|uniref:S-layer homology domain-containing protein n=1 Tax=Petroclostridium sp. X23 TaxID=3045146 RepID=UPI0024AD04EB|nr:S-layer homology domain-containing protein [Petroclostridium sp. X23]WHH57371.1 S-layer homology domain-containing protein [Petroclostridium sp. X23]
MKRYKRNDYSKNIWFGAILALILFIFNLMPVYAQEISQNSYTGTEDARATIKNIQFYDVEAQGKNYWGRDAIYEMAALSIIKGRGEGRFDLKAPITKVQALALIYRAIGKESQASQAANMIELESQQSGQSINDAEAWANGYLVLAAEDGLITSEQLHNALYDDPSMLDPVKQFVKTAPAQRQEIAEWMGKALKLTADYDVGKAVLDSYIDKDRIESSRIPYIALVVKEKLMTGHDGYLNPTQGISREEMAQVLKNAQRFILKYQGLIERSGVIISVKEIPDPLLEGNNKIILAIEDPEGSIYEILIDKNSPNNIEPSQGQFERFTKEIVTLGKGNPSDSSNLKEGDKISCLIDKNRQVRFVKVVGAQAEVRKDDVGSLTVAGIYKASIYVYDPYKHKLIVKDLKKWGQGKWIDAGKQQYTEIPVEDDTGVYRDIQKITIGDINTYYTDHEVYMAMILQPNHNEKAVLLNIQKPENIEQIYEGTVYSIDQDASVIDLKERVYRVSESSIILENGKMLGNRELANDDKVYVVSTILSDLGEFAANIIEIHNTNEDTLTEKKENDQSNNQEQENKE